MNRRSFLKWFGFGAAAVAVPAIAAPLEPMGPAVDGRSFALEGSEERLVPYSQTVIIDQMRQPRAVFHTKTVSLEEARELYPVYRDLQWTDEELAAIRAEGAGPLVINMIKPSFTIGPGRSRKA